MVVSEVIVISCGGMIFYVVVVVWGMGICCVIGCESLIVNEEVK